MSFRLIQDEDELEQFEQILLDEDESEREVVLPLYPTSREGRAETTRKTPPTHQLSFKRKRDQFRSNDPTTEVLRLAGEKLKSIHPDDEFDAYGKYIAHKLRDLRGNQQIFARKLINDVIFEAELQVLTKDCEIVNCAPSSEGQSSIEYNFPYNY